MGVSVGLVIGFIGAGIMLFPFILQLYASRKQSTSSRKHSLEFASGIIIIAMFLYIGGIILAAYYSGKTLAKAGGKLIGGGGKLIGSGGKFLEEHPQLALLAA